MTESKMFAFTNKNIALLNFSAKYCPFCGRGLSNPPQNDYYWAICENCDAKLLDLEDVNLIKVAGIIIHSQLDEEDTG
jgi:hypothetical protein